MGTMADKTVKGRVTRGGWYIAGHLTSAGDVLDVSPETLAMLVAEGEMEAQVEEKPPARRKAAQ